MSVLQRILSPLVREYWIGRTFIHRAAQALETSPRSADLEMKLLGDGDIEAGRAGPDADLRRHLPSIVPGIRSYGALIQGELAAICTFGFGEPYRRSGGFYELEQGTAELTDIFTASRFRGRGIARSLIGFATNRMHEEGYEVLFAKVWHSNHPSTHAFRAAGWKELCLFVRLYPRGTQRKWHMEWRRS